jgi:glycine cleavage system H protein
MGGSMSEYPDDRRYTKEHEWVKVEGDLGRVGITDYAQKQLGDVVYLELPEPGKALKAHEQFGTVESVKAVSELYSPVAGEVVQVNTGLVSKPEGINADPHGAAWMLELRLSEPGEVGALMDAAAYQAFVASESK